MDETNVSKLKQEMEEHDAAAEITKDLEELKLTCPDTEDTPQAQFKTTPTSDTVAELNDFCLRDGHPYPKFDFVYRLTPPVEDPELTVECRVGTIAMYGTGSTKKAAKQLAAQEVLKIGRQELPPGRCWEITTMEQMINDYIELYSREVKTNTELPKEDIKSLPGSFIMHRYHFFKRLTIEKRRKAYYILKDWDINSNTKVHLLMKAFEIPYEFKETLANNSCPLLSIRLHCDIDVLFTGKEDRVYDDMVHFFDNMMK